MQPGQGKKSPKGGRQGPDKAADTSLSLPWPLQLLQTTNNSPMNSKPQQIKMQSTKKGPLSKREEGGPSSGAAAAAAPPGDEVSSLGPGQSSGLQPQVSEGLGWVVGKGERAWPGGAGWA